MNTAKKLMLLNLGGEGSSGAAAITYLFRDEFTTDEAAPLTSPRTAVPGPGTVAIVDTGNTLSIATSILTSSALPTSDSDPRYGLTLTRDAGLLFQISAKPNLGYGSTSNNSALGLFSAQPTTFNPFNSLVGGFQLTGNPSVGAARIYPGNLSGDSVQATNPYRAYSVVCTPNTTMCFLDGVLSFVYDDTTASPWAGIAARDNTTRPFLVDYAHARVLEAPFTTDYGIATLNVSSPLDATEYVGEADALINMTVTPPASLDGSATTRCGFYYRADADLTPAWHCYVAGDGTFNVDSIAADGTRTNRLSVASVEAGGRVLTLSVRCLGSNHYAYTKRDATWTSRTEGIALSLNDTVNTIQPSVPSGWSVSNLRCYPLNSAVYEALDPN